MSKTFAFIMIAIALFLWVFRIEAQTDFITTKYDHISDCSQWNDCVSCALDDDCAWCDSGCINIDEDQCSTDNIVDTPGCNLYDPITRLSFDENEILTYTMDIRSCQTTTHTDDPAADNMECEEQKFIVSLVIKDADNTHLNYHLYGSIESIWMYGNDILHGMKSPPFCDIFIVQSAVTNITCGNWTGSIPINETEADQNKLQTDTILSILKGLLPRMDSALFKSNKHDLDFSEIEPNGRVFVHRSSVQNWNENITQITSEYHLNDFQSWDNIQPNELIVNELRTVNNGNNHITNMSKHECIGLQAMDKEYIEDIDIEITLIQQECCVEQYIFKEFNDIIYQNNDGYFSQHFSLKQWRKGQYEQDQNAKPSFQVISDDDTIAISMPERRRLSTSDYVEIFSEEKTLAQLSILGFSIEVNMFIDVGIGFPWKPKGNIQSFSPNGCSSLGDYIAKKSGFYNEITECCNKHDADYVDCDTTKIAADNALIKCIDKYNKFTAELFHSALSELPISSIYYYRAKTNYCSLDPNNMRDIIDISSGITVKINDKSIYDYYFVGKTSEAPKTHIADKNIKMYGGCIYIVFAPFCFDLSAAIKFELAANLMIKNDELIFEVSPKISAGLVIDAYVSLWVVKGGLVVRGDVIQATAPHIYVNVPLSGDINPYIGIDVKLETAVVTLSAYYQHLSIKCKCWFCACPRFKWSGKKTIWNKRYVLGSKSTLQLLSWTNNPQTGKDYVYSVSGTFGMNSTDIINLPSEESVISILHLINEYISIDIFSKSTQRILVTESEEHNTKTVSNDYQCRFAVLSVDHASAIIGQYFNFDNSVVDDILGRTDWGYENFYVFNSRTHQIQWVILWRASNGGTLGDGHGREDGGTAHPGDFQVMDMLYFVGIDANCQPSPYMFKVLSIDHAFGVTGQYFNFNNTVIDGILRRTDWGYENFNIFNSRTLQITRVILWREPNGGTIGDGHGREDDGTASPGDFQTGDILSFIGINIENCPPTPCTFTILSIDHTYDVIGLYFNFDNALIDCILGRNDWSHENFNIFNSRTEQIKKVVLWRSSNGGTVGDGHGREDDGTAHSGDFQIGDKLLFMDVSLYCEPPSDTFDVLSIDHTFDVIGLYFNFDNDAIDNMLQRNDWSHENFNVFNSRTKQIKRVVLWRSPNGGTVGDGHGREDDGTASSGDFQIGDKLSFVGMSEPVDDFEISLNIVLYDERTQNSIKTVLENDFVKDLVNWMRAINQNKEFELRMLFVSADKYLYTSK
eukprot:547268_1